jgi:hypothetical protein
VNWPLCAIACLFGGVLKQSNSFPACKRCNLTFMQSGLSRTEGADGYKLHVPLITRPHLQSKTWYICIGSFANHSKGMWYGRWQCPQVASINLRKVKPKCYIWGPKSAVASNNSNYQQTRDDPTNSSEVAPQRLHSPVVSYGKRLLVGRNFLLKAENRR